MKLLPVIALFIAFSATGETTLRYCVENPQEICFTGVYRGTWFHVPDFIPGATGFTVEWADLGLLYPTGLMRADMFVEIWNGGENGPEELLASMEIEVPQTLFVFPEPVQTGPDFWCIVNAGGYPLNVHIETDVTPQGHSFHSDSFDEWQPCEIGELSMTVGCTEFSLGRITWGSMKACL